MDDVSANRAQQTALYGAPLGDILGHCAAVLDLRQQQLAGLLGISAPMLSQLMNGHRIRIANPAAGQRLHLLTGLVAEVDEGRLAPAEAVARMEQNEAGPLLATVRTTSTLQVSEEVQSIFRATASAADYLDAAALLHERHPEIAELLRVYGTERADRAEEHTQRLRRR